MYSFVQYRSVGRAVTRQLKEKNANRSGQRSSSTLLIPSENNDIDLEARSAPTASGTGTAGSQALPPGCRYETSETSNDESERSEDNDLSKDDNANKKIIVDLVGSDDPINPQNWPPRRKTTATVILWFLIVSQAWAGSGDALANTRARAFFDVSGTVMDAGISMYLFGIGIGSLLAGPLSNSTGRNPTYMVMTILYLCFVLGTALVQSFAGYLILRFLIGLTASAVLAVNGASIRDLYQSEGMQWVFPFIAFANTIGPILSPIVGGAIASNYTITWRWCQWVTLIVGGGCFIPALFLLPETEMGMLLDWKAAHLRKQTGDQRYISERALGAGFFAQVKSTLPMPVKLFATDLVIAIFGSYLILLYILLFTFLSGFDYIFKAPYDLNDRLQGACFAAFGIGGVLFLIIDLPTRYYLKKQGTKRFNGEGSPEDCLWPAILVSPLLPISLFWMAWTARPEISIWSPLLACAAFGVLIVAIYDGIYEYIIDAYSDRASVALASITTARYIIAGGMVLAARPMYEAIGVDWALTLMGCLGLLLAPAPYIIYRYGHTLRKKSKYAQNP